MTPPAVVAAEDLDGEHSHEYGDEGFESDVPRSRLSRDGREIAEKCVEESAVLGSETGLDDADLQVPVVDARKVLCVHIISTVKEERTVGKVYCCNCTQALYTAVYICTRTSLGCAMIGALW